MRLSILSLTLLGALTLTGCANLVSLNPFITPSDSVMDPALLGTWISGDGKDIFTVRQDGNAYAVRYVTDSDTFEFKARLMTAGEVKLLDLTSANQDAFQLPAHTAVRIWLQDNLLSFAFLHTDWLQEQAKRQLTTAPADDRTVITAPGESVRAFLAAAAADPKSADAQEQLRRVQ